MIASPLWSHACSWDELAVPCDAFGTRRSVLDLERGWSERWTTSWRFGKAEVVRSVAGLGALPLAGCRPWRPFGWRTKQRHRPGLESLIGTGRLHAFESLEEDRFLVALDFAGGLLELLPQPFLLRFRAEGRWREHTPDFLAVTRGGRWLIDVRPAGRMDQDDLMRFAASQEAALAVGWRYTVVTGWRPHVATNLDSLYSRRRAMTDPLGLKATLLKASQAPGSPFTFRELAVGSGIEAVARAVLLHLLWHRQLGIDLSEPLEDRTVVWAATVRGASA
ncbi:hypothetical protein Y717_11480 [Streptomyces scopuliridis RB72]|uniref:TnsA endonuclease n=1 Tax=Streptomyces scopuliridis RB72 TaxID=1440053 RepID=A0A2T7SNN8_9ACTN|nr:hypothetical protein Y717_11480 [Streptomyces scopuliridis RB72]